MPIRVDWARWMRRILPTVIEASLLGSRLSTGKPTPACDPLTDKTCPQVGFTANPVEPQVWPALTVASTNLKNKPVAPERSAPSARVTIHGLDRINQPA